MRILVVEDDHEIAGIVRQALIEQLYTVELAHDGETARHAALSEAFDLIILDIMIPKLDGIEVCRAIRSAGQLTPIMMLTARRLVHDRIEGLNAGADDYLLKPFAIGELLARVQALLRRAQHRTEEVLAVGALSLDPRTSFVQLDTRRIELTAREFALLQFFMQHPDRIVTRTEILEQVWDSNYQGLGNVIDVYVNRLRNKLGRAGGSGLIETVRSRGYILRSGQDG